VDRTVRWLLFSENSKFESGSILVWQAVQIQKLNFVGKKIGLYKLLKLDPGLPNDAIRDYQNSGTWMSDLAML